MQREREHGSSLGAATGRLIELRERVRGAQTPAAGALPLRDGNGGSEGVFGWSGVSGMAPEQEFAAGPVELRFERAVAEVIGRR